MRKLIIFVIIGWMSVMTVCAQEFIGNIGYNFKGTKPDGIVLSGAFYEGYGMLGFHTKFPSSNCEDLRIGVDVGASVAWRNFMLSPYMQASYIYQTRAKSSNFGTGLGIQGIVKVVGPVGVFIRYQYTIFPLMPNPFSNGEHNLSTGVSLIWFLWCVVGFS